MSGGSRPAFNHKAGGHAFDFDTRACVNCGMTQEEFQDKKQPACTGHKPMNDTDKIFADASQRATLRYAGKSVHCPTLQEAVLEQMRLSDTDRAEATIRTDDGTVYDAGQINRLHIK